MLKYHSILVVYTLRRSRIRHRNPTQKGPIASLSDKEISRCQPYLGPRRKSSTLQFMTDHVARPCKRISAVVRNICNRRHYCLFLTCCSKRIRSIICRPSQHPCCLPSCFRNTVPPYFTLHIQHASPKRLKATSALYGVGTPKTTI